MRKIGRSLSAAVQVGKGGVTESLARQLGTLLSQHELIKIRVLDSAGADVRSAADALAEAAGAAVVSAVGRTCLLYRANPDLSRDKRVKLPSSS